MFIVFAITVLFINKTFSEFLSEQSIVYLKAACKFPLASLYIVAYLCSFCDICLKNIDNETMNELFKMKNSHGVYSFKWIVYSVVISVFIVQMWLLQCIHYIYQMYAICGFIMKILWIRLKVQSWKVVNDHERVLAESGKALWCTENVDILMDYHLPSSCIPFLEKMQNEFENYYASHASYPHILHVKTACNSADICGNRTFSSVSYPSSLSSKSDTENSEQIKAYSNSSSIKTKESTKSESISDGESTP